MQDKIIRSVDVLHPELRDAHKIIRSEIIGKHNMPIRLFETGRTRERHEMLLRKGLVSGDIVCKHRFDLQRDIYATAMAYVYYDGRWSFNIRNARVKRWLQVFGEMVLDKFDNIKWQGYNRERTDYTTYELI